MPDDTQPNDHQLTADELKELRDAANRSKANKAEAEKANREIAFLKVVGTEKIDHPLIQRLMASYDGDLSKEKVTEYLDGLQVGTLLEPAEATTTEPVPDPAAPPKPETPATAAELRQAQERTGAIDGGETPTGVPAEHPARTGLVKAFEIIEKGGTREDGATAFFHEVFSAAVAGDQRVLTANRGGEYVPA